MLLLLFYCGEKQYGCSYENIVEVLPLAYMHKTTTLSPQAAGILDYGEKLIPVFDLCRILEQTTYAELMHTRILVFKGAGMAGFSPYAVIVEKAAQTIEAPPSFFIR